MTSPLPLLVASLLIDAAQPSATDVVQPATPPDSANTAPASSLLPPDRSDVSTRSAAMQPDDATLKPDTAQAVPAGASNSPSDAPTNVEPTPAAPTNDAPTTVADAVDPTPSAPTEAPASTPAENNAPLPSPSLADPNPPAPAEPPPADDAASNPAPVADSSSSDDRTSTDESESPDESSSTEHSSNWSLHFLRHCTILTSILLICIGSTVWLAGIKLFRFSPPTACALMLTLWALVSCNAVVAAWTAEAGSQSSVPDGAPVLPGDRDGSSWGLDLGTASGAATFAALLGTIGGIAFLAWIMACSKSGAQHAPRIVAVIWGILLGSIVHTGGISWLLDTSAPETLAWTMHGSLLLCCIFCSALTLLHMHRDERSGLIAATAGCGSWSLVRGLVMILLFIETATEAHKGKEMDRSWKWPNEWNLPLIDEAHPSRVSSFDGAASDPSYASSVPYSSLAGSVTQDQIVMNVNASYFFYLGLISMLFIVGASIQSIRPRSSRQLLAQFLDSKQSSRRGSSHALLGGGSGGSGSGGGSRKLSSGSLPSASTMYRGSSYSEGSYGSLGSSTPNSSNGHAHGNGRSRSHAPATYYHRRPASDDLNVGSSSAAWDRQGSSGSGGGGSADLERGLPASGNSRSISSSPHKAAKSASRSTNKTAANASANPANDWSRRTSFALAIDVAADPARKGRSTQHANGSNVSRSPSAPVLSALDDDLAAAHAAALPGGGVPAATTETHYILSPILSSDAPPSDFAPKQLVVRAAAAAPPPRALSLGGVSGSLRRMQQVASALKADRRKHQKKSISFMTEFGVVQPQRTPEPPVTQDPASADLVLQMHDSSSPPLQPSPRDCSAPAALPAMHPTGSLEASPLSGASQATPITPAWSPYPLVTREDLEAEAERELLQQQVAALAGRQTS